MPKSKEAKDAKEPVKEAVIEAPAPMIIETPKSGLARRNKITGEISARARGRPNPDYENGFIDGAGAFQVGEPLNGSSRKRRNAAASSASASRVGLDTSGLSEIEMIVNREVERRLKAAKDAAIRAIEEALNV